MEYLPRIADGLLAKKLSYAGAVCIRGPKWCGKTSTAEQKAKSAVYLQDPDRRADTMLLAQTKPSLLLRGEQPRLIDEWQDAPQLWDAVRFSVDREQAVGAYLLTGSAVPGKQPSHTGTGRISTLVMRPMSLFESRESTGEVSLAHMFSAADDIFGKSDADVEDIAWLCCRGGWPRGVSIGGDVSLEIPFDYVHAVCSEDISRVDEVERDSQFAHLVMREYARCTSTMVSFNSMRGDLAKRGDVFSKDAFNSYISAFRKIYAIEDLPSWVPSLHARSRIVRTPARFLCDPSIAAASMGASPQLLLKDASTLGMLFENLCVRDVRAYAEALGGKVMRYHDSTGLEADIVVELRDGRYALMEVKLGAAFVDEGSASLRKLSVKLDTNVMGSPSFCAVIVPGGYAYRRDDGVYVIPISCLAP
ncbi:MAG: DUF4143 domain-containing protein [Coriobacteriales bacterium]|nr:DUF4143 domain-containing protein [Coriobacteriales bacterium]